MTLIVTPVGGWIVPDIAFLLLTVLTLISFFITYTVFKHCREYYSARMQEVYQHKVRYLETSETSSGRWKAVNPFRGTLRTKLGDYYLRDPPIRGEGEFYIAFKGFCINVSLDKAAAVDTLTEMNLGSLVQALEKYEKEYFDKKEIDEEAFKKEVSYLIAKQPALSEREAAGLVLTGIKQEGIKYLMSLNWVTPFTVPLNKIYRDWCYRESADAIMNKNLTDSAVNQNDQEWLRKVEKMKTGIPVANMVFYIAMLLVCGAIAVYILNLVNQQNQLKEVVQTITTTTTSFTTTTLR